MHPRPASLVEKRTNDGRLQTVSGTAYNGFEALWQLKRSPAFDLIVADLNMPKMSGVDFLSVVRRRFPQPLVIAVAGDCHSGDAAPGGVIADAFHAADQQHPETLLRTVADLIRTFKGRAAAHHGNSESSGILQTIKGSTKPGAPELTT
jgi:CheY-like chemotaxis protein